MKLSTQIDLIAKEIQKNKSFSNLTEELEEAALSLESRKTNPLAATICEFNRELIESGVFPLKFAATYWSQSKIAENRYLELSWQRNDLIIHKSLQPLKVPRSHGPGFRIRIFGDGFIDSGIANRFSGVGEAAKSNFANNVINDDGLLEWCFERNLASHSFTLNWIGDEFEAESFKELQSYVRRKHSKTVNNFIHILAERIIKPTTTPTTFAKSLSTQFKEISPFYYAMLFNLQPKKAKTHTSMKGQLTREQLRLQLLKHESHCQNEDCKIPKNLQVLEMAHMVPGIHELSNVLALCSVCHGQQRPRNSDIVLDGLLSDKDNIKIYGVTVSTSSGEQNWRIKSRHILKRF